MIDALWSLQFAANATPLGGSGVVVIENGRVLGGDSSFLFIGDVKVEGGTVKARVHVTKYQDVPGMSSVTGLNNYVGIFEGQVDAQNVTLTGIVEGMPTIKLVAKLTRRAELPN